MMNMGFHILTGRLSKGSLEEMAGVFVQHGEGEASDKGKEIGEILERRKGTSFLVLGWKITRHDKVKFSDCEISKEVRDYFKNSMGESNT